MDRRIAWVGARAMRGAMAAVAVITLIGAPGSVALAQTLTDPNPPAKWPPPRAAAKYPSTARAKSCSAYGAGFVNVPGTNACIKVGGWVSVEGAASR